MKRIVSILLIAFFVFAGNEVLAAIVDGTPYILPNPPDSLSWIGSAGGYAGVANSGRPCEPTDLCFSGSGLYMK